MSSLLERGRAAFPPAPPPSLEVREAWRAENLARNDIFIHSLPKVELHIHIEGTLSAALRWKLAHRNGVPLFYGPSKIPVTSLAQLESLYRNIRGRIGAASAVGGHDGFTFFEAYYGGFDVLIQEEDYFELAMAYFEKAKEMNVRYAEVFFDVQGHIRRGVAVSTVMNGFRRAQLKAEKELNVKSQWILCILRDMSPASAMEAYEAALPHKEMIVGIGLDSDELNHPPSLFSDVYTRARLDGFRLTAHCDFDQVNTHEHVRQVLTIVGGTGADRCDHGMNVADGDELVELFKSRSNVEGSTMGLTLCPCAYIRNKSEKEVFGRIRKLVDAGVRISVASDDPTYMGQNWVEHNLLFLKYNGGFTDTELLKMERDGVIMSWAEKGVKEELLKELAEFGASQS